MESSTSEPENCTISTLPDAAQYDAGVETLNMRRWRRHRPHNHRDYTIIHDGDAIERSAMPEVHAVLRFCLLQSRQSSNSLGPLRTKNNPVCMHCFNWRPEERCRQPDGSLLIATSPWRRTIKDDGYLFVCLITGYRYMKEGKQTLGSSRSREPYVLSFDEQPLL